MHRKHSAYLWSAALLKIPHLHSTPLLANGAYFGKDELSVNERDSVRSLGDVFRPSSHTRHPLAFNEFDVKCLPLENFYYLQPLHCTDWLNVRFAVVSRFPINEMQFPALDFACEMIRAGATSSLPSALRKSCIKVTTPCVCISAIDCIGRVCVHFT